MRGAFPLGAFWLLYFGGLGIFFPYYSLFLRENAGLSETQVGLVVAALPLVGTLAQPFWGALADRSGARVRVLSLLCLGAGLGQLALWRSAGFAELFVATALLAGFGTAVVPQAVAVSLAARPAAGAHGFGRVRVWGTLGFLLFVVGFPLGLERLQTSRGWLASESVSEPGLEWMFPVAAALYGAAALVVLGLPRGGETALRARRGDWRALSRHRPVIALLGFSLLAYLFLQGPIGLFALLVRAHGGSMETVGQLWVLMLALEVPLVLYTGAVAERLGPRGLLLVGVVAGGVRWTVCGLAGPGTATWAVQILHGVTVAGLVIGGPLYLEAAVPPALRSTAQGLLGMIGAGLGGMASNVATGWLLGRAGPDATYLAAGLGALVCAAGMLLCLPAPRRPGVC